MTEINKIVHYSDLHLKLYKQHKRDKKILEDALIKWKELKPDRIVLGADSIVDLKGEMISKPKNREEA